MRRSARNQSRPRLRNVLAQLPLLPRALSLVWSAAPLWAGTSMLCLTLQGVLPVATVFLTRSLVNSLIELLQGRHDGDRLSNAILLVVLIGAVVLTTEILGSITGYIRLRLSEDVQDRLKSLIHARAVSLDMEFYESPGYYDQLHRAGTEAMDRPLALLQNIGDLIQNSLTLIAMGGVLWTFSWWMPLVLLVSTLPALWVALETAWRFHRWRLESTVIQRRLFYYNHLLTADTAVAELRVFDLGGFFTDGYRSLRRQLRSGRLRLAKREMLGRVAASVFGLIASVAALGWVGWRTLHKQFSMGDLAMFYQALNQGQRLLRSLLNSVGEIYKNMVFLEDLFDYLNLQPKVTDPPRPKALSGLRDAIRLENVSFRYPGSEQPALDGFELVIPAGRVVAIVGENGAGKSTLIKLLCRFYDPNGGRITWDGIDLREMAQADLRRRVTVLFQQPVPYHNTVSENIAFGDLARHPAPHEIQAAACAAGAHQLITLLPKGYDTLLGRWFGFQQLSTGEWQRVALARAFVRRADLVLLDEPTSAMDSWAEARWMNRFRTLVAGRTAVIITHRFTTALQADVIHVMDEGRIVETGSHAELLAMNGRYAESWRQQMRAASGAAPGAPEAAPSTSAQLRATR